MKSANKREDMRPPKVYRQINRRLEPASESTTRDVINQRNALLKLESAVRRRAPDILLCAEYYMASCIVWFGAYFCLRHASLVDKFEKCILCEEENGQGTQAANHDTGE